ncbi:hypothetical protein TNCV_2659671 [Trichonephila clavipes]|uniref:Uncharacterized protein n=1 Tax=Trichonephila clavipes TaxID=2585209 RepID=A0A8X6R522_TRICX|nr:hypothetical protein TNCV_2659671 [Trichonephila clavipes]
MESVILICRKGGAETDVKWVYNTEKTSELNFRNEATTSYCHRNCGQAGHTTGDVTYDTGASEINRLYHNPGERVKERDRDRDRRGGCMQEVADRGKKPEVMSWRARGEEHRKWRAQTVRKAYE